MEDTLRLNLLRLAVKFQSVEHISLQAIALRAIKDSTFFIRIAAGSGFTIRTYDRLVRWFSENWPAGMDWPSGIARPVDAAPREPEAAE